MYRVVLFISDFCTADVAVESAVDDTPEAPPAQDDDDVNGYGLNVFDDDKMGMSELCVYFCASCIV